MDLRLDVLISADEKMVVHHDPRLNSDHAAFENWVTFHAGYLCADRSTRSEPTMWERAARLFAGNALPFPAGHQRKPIPMLSDLVAWWQNLTPDHRFSTLNSNQIEISG